MTDPLPYKIAVLCYLYDERGRLLMLHRVKDPNAGMYSPIGGKLEVGIGESPHHCASREIHEEAGIEIPPAQLHMTGIVAETAYEGRSHWLIFLFEVTRPVRAEEITEMTIDEGRLEWVPIDDVETIGIPESDRRVMWPLVRAHRGGFFVVHIDCADGEIAWTVQETSKRRNVETSK